ncbi:MAG TPA: 4Fe-4S single cluster domain-containing protein [Bacillota bacterium]|nr:4Fe-4S single cluster domain-containing protein [Bacillota bacterium]
MKLRIAGMVGESVADGPGLRFVIFVQGCRRRCKGCHNPHTWDPEGGTVVPAGELLERVKTAGLIKGVTFSGGEPFLQAGQLAWLGREVKKLGLDVITFTGYTWEELLELSREDGAVKGLLLVSDFIVDGPFILEERDLELPFRGSGNQRIIDVAKSLQSGGVVKAGFA